MLDRLQELNVRIAQHLGEGRLTVGRGDANRYRGRKAPDDIVKLSMIGLHRVRLPKDYARLPAEVQQQRGPGCK